MWDLSCSWSGYIGTWEKCSTLKKQSWCSLKIVYSFMQLFIHAFSNSPVFLSFMNLFNDYRAFNLENWIDHFNSMKTDHFSPVNKIFPETEATVLWSEIWIVVNGINDCVPGYTKVERYGVWLFWIPDIGSSKDTEEEATHIVLTKRHWGLI